MSGYVREHADRRRTEPRDDLLTKLVEAEVDGLRLTDLEVVDFAGLQLVAGHITTTMLLGSTALCLDANPAERERVAAGRSLVPAAIEESLRMLSPFPVTARVTHTGTELGGKEIPADQLLVMWFAAVNRDPNQHLASGRGLRFCVGTPLIKLEGGVAINPLLDRYPNPRCDPPVLPTLNMTGAQKLPLLLF